MKDQEITGSHVYTREAKTPGKVTETPSEITEATGVESAQKVIEFDGKPSETLTDTLTGDEVFPGPVDLKDRNPIVIDPPTEN